LIELIVDRFVADYLVVVFSWKSDLTASEADVQDINQQTGVELQEQHGWTAGREGIPWTPGWRVGSDCVWPS